MSNNPLAKAKLEDVFREYILLFTQKEFLNKWPESDDDSYAKCILEMEDYNQSTLLKTISNFYTNKNKAKNAIESIKKRFINVATKEYNSLYFSNVSEMENDFSKPEIRAIFGYRFINLFINEYMEETNDSNGTYITKQGIDASFKKMVRRFSETIRYLTGIDINPFAKIGKNFKIIYLKGDTIVIGERCNIGDDCKIYGDVVLGVNQKIKVKPKDRHPKLGNKVTIKRGSRILGNIFIGSESTIESGCIIIKSVPESSIVYNNMEFQVFSYTDNELEKPLIYTVLIDGANIKILGKNLSNLTPKILTLDNYNENDIHSVTINENCICFSSKYLQETIYEYYISLVDKRGRTKFLIKKCEAFKKFK